MCSELIANKNYRLTRVNFICFVRVYRLTGGVQNGKVVGNFSVVDYRLRLSVKLHTWSHTVLNGTRCTKVVSLTKEIEHQS